MGYRVIRALDALGSVLVRGVSVGKAVVCASGAGMRVEGSSSMAGILDGWDWGWVFGLYVRRESDVDRFQRCVKCFVLCADWGNCQVKGVGRDV